MSLGVFKVSSLTMCIGVDISFCMIPIVPYYRLVLLPVSAHTEGVGLRLTIYLTKYYFFNNDNIIQVRTIELFQIVDYIHQAK